MEPIKVNINDILIENIADARETIFDNGAAVYRLNISKAERDSAVNKTKFYANVNDMFKESVQEPTLVQKLNPKTVPKQRVPMAAQGFINEYFTPIHSLINKNKEVGKLFDAVYKKKTKRAINRLRLCQKSKVNANSLHIEGEEIFTKHTCCSQMRLNPDPEIGCIAAITGIRSFVFWHVDKAGSRNCGGYLLHKYWKDNGSKNFMKIDPVWMNEYYGNSQFDNGTPRPGARKIVTVDCKDNIYLIFFNHVLPHEIALSPSLSAFISPITDFNKTKITKTCSFHPPEYLGLTKHESNLLGACYNRPGYEWPSGKSAHLIHHRAYSFYTDRLKDRYLKTKPDGNKTIQMRLPTHGTINQKSKDYQRQLKERGIILPQIAFAPNTPNFVVDLLDRSDYELKLYGFIINDDLSTHLYGS